MELNKVYLGDCMQVMKEFPDNSVDSICCDPPYELGFMGKSWDNTGIANNKDMWAECLRVLKPGGHLLAFSGTRTYHRMASAIEDAGFEVRDMIEWVYSTGFPKSLNIGKAVDKLQGNEREKFIRTDGAGNKQDYLASDRTKTEAGVFGGDKQIFEDSKGTSEWEGWGTALKPAHEPICMARKPLAEKTVAENCIKWGTGGINIDESRVEGQKRSPGFTEATGNKQANNAWNNGMENKNNDTSLGRFPANLIHDNSEEVRECFPETKSVSGGRSTGRNFGQGENEGGKDLPRTGHDDSGNASRFFKSIIYQAKASKSERNKGCEGLEEKPKVFNGQSDKPSTDMKDVEKRFTTLPKVNNHPTVKPIALMEYLIKMVTPKGGIVLDPFAGSGSTLVAAKQNGFNYIGIEMTDEYIPIIEARLLDKQNQLL